LLYLIGGPARSGKSVLAGRLLQQHRVPYFSLDYLTSGLSLGAPVLGVHHDLSARERGERLWAVVEPMLRNIAEVEPAYLIEGEAFLPDRLAALAKEYGGVIRVCFLGYARCDVEAKTAAIRAHPSPVNDWVAGLTPEALVSWWRRCVRSARSLKPSVRTGFSRIAMAVPTFPDPFAMPSACCSAQPNPRM
jgi:hypothetical protein